MKPNSVLTVAGIYYILDAIADLLIARHFDFNPYAYAVYGISLGVLFLMTRNESASRIRDAVFMTGLLSSAGLFVVAFYAQWTGTFETTAIGYIAPAIWLIIASTFLLVGRANMSVKS